MMDVRREKITWGLGNQISQIDVYRRFADKWQGPMRDTSTQAIVDLIGNLSVLPRSETKVIPPTDDNLHFPIHIETNAPRSDVAQELAQLQRFVMLIDQERTAA